MSEVRVSEWLWLEGTSKMTWSNPCMAPSRDSWRRLLKTRCSQVCMALQMRFRHLSGQTVPVFHYPHSKKCVFLCSDGISHFSLCSSPLVPSLGTTNKGLSPASSLPALRYLHIYLYPSWACPSPGSACSASPPRKDAPGTSSFSGPPPDTHQCLHSASV